MRVVVINASLKKEEGISSLLIERMIPYLKDCEYGVLKVSDFIDKKVLRRILKAADAFVIVTPVSWGGLPSSLSGLLSEMEFLPVKQNIPVCTVIHGEQYDPSSFMHAENILRIWSERCHLHLCMNILIGGSDQLPALKSISSGTGVFRKADHAFRDLAEALQNQEKPDQSFSIGSSFLYKRTMEKSWKKELERNGQNRSGKVNENSFNNA